ncbi:MAG: ABC transporter ATP-binding protein/permease [Clostridiales bacterium]|jgi:ABC-type multidrug transport system fused ATPase/permease subunit|nr:ABC transporter ATP-binding protein/permease [Clostridiales bacterium]
MKRRRGGLLEISAVIGIHKPYWMLATFGALLTAAPWYASNLLNGLLMRTAVEMSAKSEGRLLAVAWIAAILILTRIPTILGYGMNALGSARLSGLIQRKMIESWLRRDKSSGGKLSASDVMTRVIADCGVELGDFFFQGGGLNIIEPLAAGAAAIVTVVRINGWMAAFALGMAILSFTVSYALSDKVQIYINKTQEARSDCAESLSNITSAGMTMRLFRLEERFISAFTSKSDDVAANQYRAASVKRMIALLSDLTEMLTSAGFFTLGYIFSANGKLYFPDMMIAVSMQPLITRFVGGLSSGWQYLESVGVSARRVNEVLALRPDDARKAMPDAAPAANSPMLELENVHFSYEGSEPILRGISLCVRPGERIAVVGPSGQGKSTLMKIIAGELAPQSGAVRVMGNDLKEVNASSWKGQFAIVPQENNLFHISIRDNIRMGRYEKSTDEDVTRAAKSAGIHEAIESLPLGYDSVIGAEGFDLSGGQRRRVAIARALISEAPILLVDEPTGGLDHETEYYLQKALFEGSEARTMILISHSRSLAEKADRILTLSSGCASWVE